MRAAVLKAPHQLVIEERASPQPEPGWVALAVEAAGICGTDVAVYLGKHPAKLPVVMGHEFCGHVLAVGEGVENLEPGQAVMAEGSWRNVIPAPGAAPISGALGRTVDGCFADYVLVPAAAVHSVRPAIHPHEAQSITTLATAIHAARRAGDLVAQRVAIVGPGHAGLLLLQVVLASDPEIVTILGTRAERLQIAAELGAGAVINVRAPEQADWLDGAGRDSFDVVFEASGRAAGLAHALSLVRRSGVIVCYGIINEHLETVSGYNLYAKELNIFGARGAAGCYNDAIAMLAAGSVRVSPLVSHILPLADAKHGFDLITGRRDRVLRVVLAPPTKSS